MRQLENFIERLVVLSDGPRITLDVQRVLSQQEVQFATQSIPSSSMMLHQPTLGSAGDLEERIRGRKRKRSPKRSPPRKGAARRRLGS